MGARARDAVGAAVAAALLFAAPAGAQSIPELGAFADAQGCVAGRVFNVGKAGAPTAPFCAVMTRQHDLSDLVASPGVKRLYAVDVATESVVAYRTLEGGGVRELTGPGSCASLSGARARCRLVQGVEDRGGGQAAISPDGRFLYVLSSVRAEHVTGVPDPPPTVVIDVFRAAGGLEWTGCVSRNGTDGRGAAVCSSMRGPSTGFDLVASADGRNLYLVSSPYFNNPDGPPPERGIAVFARDSESGSLRQLDGAAGCVTQRGAGGSCAADSTVDGLTDFVLAPGGRAAYATSQGGAGARGGAFALRRDPATGALEVARGPGTCVGAFAGRTDCTADEDIVDAPTLSLSPDGRFLYVSSLPMVVLAVDEVAPALTRLGCVTNGGYPKSCAQVGVDPTEGARMTFTPDGRTALLTNDNEIESLARDPASGALTSRGCIAATGNGFCSYPVQDLAVSNLAIVPGGGVVYAGESSTIYTLAPAAPVTATTLPLTTDGTVSIPVRCDAPPTRGCRGTLGLEGLEAGIDVGRVPFSVPSGHSKQVLVRVPASVRRAIVRRRRVEFLAETRIGVREHRRLLSSRLLRIDATRPVRRPTCRRGGVRTLRRTPRARIYTVRTPIFREVYETTYGCLFSAGRPVPLDEPVLVEAAPPFRIVGPLVAYKYEFAAEGPNDATTYVRVVDLRTGRERRALCALGPDECSLEGSSAEVRTIVVLPSGGVAWTASTGPDSLVVKADAGREPRVLDEAEGRIHLASLRLHGHRLTWKNRDRTRSATLR